MDTRMKHKFSDTFERVMGIENLMGNCWPSFQQQLDVQRALIEHILLSSFDSIPVPPGVVKYRHKYLDWIVVDPDGECRWRWRGQKGQSLLTWYAMHRDMREQDYIHETAINGGLTLGALFFDSGGKALLASKAAAIHAPEPFLPGGLVADDCSYKISDLEYLYSPHGNFVGGLAFYQGDGGKNIVIPLHPRKWTAQTYRLYAGYSQDAPPIRADMIEKYKGAIILLCDNIHIARSLNAIIANAPSPRFGEFIATCWHGGIRLAKVGDTGCLYNRSIIYVPDLRRESYRATKDYGELCKQAGARCFRVLLAPVVRFALNASGEDIHSLHDQLELNLATEAISLAGAGASILDEMNHEAVSENEFRRWGNNNGLHNDGGKPSEVRIQAKSVNNLIGRPPLAERNAEPTLNELFIPDYPTVIYGESDAGKSMVLTTALHGAAHGIPVFNLAASKPIRGLLFDAETGESNFQERCQRIASAYPYRAEYKDNFQYVSLLEYGGKDACDLSTAAGKAMVEQIILAGGYDVVAFDNLKSLLTGSARFAKQWDDFFQWAHGLSLKHNFALVMAHHKNAVGDLGGSISIHQVIRNAIDLTGQKKLRDEHAAGKLGEGFVQYINEPGCLVRFRFTKCKHYPELTTREHGYFLSWDKHNPTQGEPWIEVLDEGKPVVGGGAESTPETEGALPAPAPLLMDPNLELIIAEASKVYDFVRQDVQRWLGIEPKERGRANRLLSKLCDAGRIKTKGKGANARYVLVTPRAEDNISDERTSAEK